jgi:putative cell wall-binding protein
VSEQEYPTGAPVVFIADGQNFPDALSAGPAAAAMGGPVLLTAPGWIPAQVSDEISRLKPSKIVVVGGTVSVSASVFSELHGLVSNTVRWAGADRYATSRAVAANAFPNGSAGVFIATATNFPDALAAGAVAASFGEPILLLDGREPWLSDADVTALNALGPSRIDIVGGTASVSSGVEADLNTGGAIVSRWAGQDRYETAERLNEAFYNTSGTNGAQPGSTTVFLATGTNFPDALSAGPWAGGIAVAPLYSVPAGCVPQQVLADINGLGATQVVLIGGTATLTSGVAALTPCG